MTVWRDRPFVSGQATVRLSEVSTGGELSFEIQTRRGGPTIDSARRLEWCAGPPSVDLDSGVDGEAPQLVHLRENKRTLDFRDTPSARYTRWLVSVREA